ncbi:coiled-coil domain-containing protein 50 isoform 2-T2 [Odontesthes bonariensis]|uniref:coiled-coil domain-containing protein 50 isoform X2 n=1 Tax=Odontesthes bonariensis TaxID=219752 RepID=UPI003F58ACE3
MAECNVSIDKNKLPGVKEVCRDFAVLEDHSLAYNLQEQEIESHLASNVHKSRLVQKDLLVAKKLQEEEDERAKIQNQKQHVEIERQDNEIAQEIQEELVRQAEWQRQQEEKDAAIARKMQEKEMKEERKRQKQLETNFDEDYFEDHAAARPLDVDKPSRHKSSSPGRYDTYSPVRSRQDHSPDHYSTEPKRSRYPKLDSVAPHSHSRYPEHYLAAEGGRHRNADPYPEHLLPSRGKHGDRYPEYEPAHTGRARDQGGRDTDRVVRRKERPARPPPPQSPIERDTVLDRDRHRHDRDRGRDQDWERHVGKDQRRGREQDGDKERSRDGGRDVDRYEERDRQRRKDKQQARTRSRERELEDDFPEPGHSRDRPKGSRASWEEEEDDGRRRARSRQRTHSSPNEVFDEFRSTEERDDTREPWDPRQGEDPGRERSHSHPNRETGRIVNKVSGAVIRESEYGLNEATKGLVKLDLREQEQKDMEVARKLQEEEIKNTTKGKKERLTGSSNSASKMHVRAAQVAQDEEIARLMMEQEKKEYRKNREREKEKERERDRLAVERMAMERRRQEGEYRPNPEEVVRPRTREEADYQRQKNHSKPARPPQPRTHDYENVNSGYGYSDNPVASRPPTRPEAAYKGAYHKR